MKSKAKVYFYIFLLCFLTRWLFYILLQKDVFELFTDSYRYDILSNKILEGDINFDITGIIVAPLFPYFLAGLKYIFGNHWVYYFISFQFALVSLSAVYIFKLSKLCFNSFYIGIASAFIYILYPYTLWYNFTLVQETMFQCLFIFFVFYLVSFLKKKTNKSLFLMSTFFAFALLTKGHIILLLPMIALLLLLRTGMATAVTFGLIIITFCLPHSIHTYKKHNIFTLSSYGSGSLFWAGHSEFTYHCLIQESENRISQNGCDLDFLFDPNFIHNKVQINQTDWQIRNVQRTKHALRWIKANPSKFMKLKIKALLRFFIPGVDWQVYSIQNWIISLLFGSLIYIPSLFYLLKHRNTTDILVTITLLISLSVFLMFTVFYPQSRFRIITLEPILIIMASPFYYQLVKSKIKKRWHKRYAIS